MNPCNGRFLSQLYEEPAGALRKNLEPVYHRNGAIYLCKRELLMEKNKLVCESPLALIMNKTDSVNIDDEQDLRIADFLMSELAFNHKPATEG